MQVYVKDLLPAYLAAVPPDIISIRCELLVDQGLGTLQQREGILPFF